MAKIFRKDKMLARLELEGRTGQIDEALLFIIENLDGCVAEPNMWRRTVYGESDAWYCQTPDGEQFPVNPNDCDDVDCKGISSVSNYYDIHVRYGDKDKDGYSIPISAENQEAAIQKAISEKRFEYPDDIRFIDSITEIDETEYNHMLCLNR